MASIEKRVDAVRADIVEACHRVGRDPRDVRLIAVTKQQGADVLPMLAAAGISDYGENRVEHLELMASAAPAGSRFHAIGRLQGRQLAQIVAHACVVHSLCDVGHIERLARLLAAAGRRMQAFLQVNTSGEASKAGVAPERASALLEAARAHAELDVIGLMTMAAPMPIAGEGDARRCFASLRELALRHGLQRLSMGMSDDFVIAIEEGATDIRVGTRLFDDRA